MPSTHHRFLRYGGSYRSATFHPVTNGTTRELAISLGSLLVLRISHTAHSGRDQADCHRLYSCLSCPQTLPHAHSLTPLSVGYRKSMG